MRERPVLLSTRVPVSHPYRGWAALCVDALHGMWNGDRTFGYPPLSIESVPPFRRRCWDALRAIPPGCTISYAELSRRAGVPGASRAAGTACATNPLPLFVPCHRVRPSDGTLGHFSAGVAWKRALLELEGVRA